MADTPLIDAELAAFLQSGVSVHAASRDAANVPSLMRGVGCRVSPDGRLVTVFLLSSQCARLLEDFAANGAIAFVASQPSTHRTVQLKGTDARREALLPGDEALIARQRQAFAQDLAGAGYDESVGRTLVGDDGSEPVAVTFTPAEAFVQTPGPGAGAPLAGKR